MFSPPVDPQDDRIVLGLESIMTAAAPDDGATAYADAPPSRHAVGWYSWLLGGATLMTAAGACLRLRSSRLGCQQSWSRSQTLGLYRQILRTAQHWPSIKREAVVLSIREEFRRNAGETRPEKLERMFVEAQAGLAQLSRGAAEASRVRATPKAQKGTWPADRHRRVGLTQQWALDELGISHSPTMESAKEAYRERAKLCHPDSGGPSADAEAFKRLTLAYEHAQKHLPQTHMGGGRVSHDR